MKKIIFVFVIMFMFMSSNSYSNDYTYNKTFDVDSSTVYITCKIKMKNYIESFENNTDFMLNLFEHEIAKSDGTLMTSMVNDSYYIEWVEKSTMYVYRWRLNRYTLELVRTTVKPHENGSPKSITRFDCLKILGKSI